MTVVETLLVFAGIPLGAVLLVSFAVFGRSALQAPNRYRPGKAWTYAPAWYLPHPDALTDAVADRVQIEGTRVGEGTPAIEGASGAVAVAVGGANGEW